MKRFHQLGMIAVAMAASAIVGCSSKITDDQKAELLSLRQQETTLKQQISAAEQEKAGLQNELNARRTAVDRCNADIQFVTGKVALWPDVWPDWKPTPPQGSTASPRR